MKQYGMFQQKLLTKTALWLFCGVLLSACGGSKKDEPPVFTVTASAGSGGSISPGNRSVQSGQTTTFTVTADNGYSIASVTGCNGSLSGNAYTTGVITAACEVKASFKQAVSGVAFFEKELTFSGEQTVTLYSAIKTSMAHTVDEIQFSVATHLQALLLLEGQDYDTTEQELRAAFGLFTHSALALIPPTHDGDLNNRVYLLSERSAISVQTLLTELKDELSTLDAPQYYFTRLDPLQPIGLSSQNVTVVNNTPVSVVVDIGSLAPLNPNYTLSLHNLDYELTQLDANRFEFLVDKPGATNIFLDIKNVNTDQRDGLFIQTVSSGFEQQITLRETEAGDDLVVTGGLLVNAADVSQHGTSWEPVQLSSTSPDGLLAITVEELTGPVTFTYQYSAAAVPNPLELIIEVEDELNSRLIAPDNVDYINNTVTFTYKPAVSGTQVAVMDASKVNTSSNRVMLHIRQVKGAPTGKDIDNLLDGRRSYLEQAVRAGLGIVTDLRRDISTEQQAFNALIEPLYSSNSATKAIARAKLTKVLQQREPNGKYAYYEQFTTAINMAIAAEVLENISWLNGETLDLLIDCYPVPKNCDTYLNIVYRESGPKLLNEGLSLYLGSSSLSRQQNASIQIFNVLAALVGSGSIPKNNLEFGVLLSDLGIAAFADNPWVGRTWDVSKGFAEYLLAAGRLSTVGTSLVVGETINFITDGVETHLESENVKAYTPVIFALKHNKDKLFEKSTTWAGVAAPWNRDDFRNSFLTGPFESLRGSVQPPVETGKSWNSQFGTYLDPGRRLEPLLLSAPATWEASGWVAESYVTDKARYEALYFLSAAFGDKQKAQNLKQQAELAMSFTVTKGLLDAAKISDENVTVEIKFGQLWAATKELHIASQYASNNSFLCYKFGAVLGSQTCRNVLNENTNQNLLIPSAYVNNSSSKKFIGSFANVAGAAELNEVLYLQLQPNAYQALQNGALVFSNLSLEVKGYDIKLANQEASLDNAIQPLMLSYGRVDASQFNYDATLDRYVLPLPKLFPQLAHSNMNNRLLGFGLQARFEHAGKVRTVSGLVAYTTVVDDRYIVNTELHTETIRGRVLSVSNQPVENVLIRTSPGNRIVTTDEQGNFELSALNLGRYSLFIAAPAGSVTFSPYSTDKYEFSAVFTANPVSTGGTGKLNDTGIDWCANADTNNLACPVAGFEGQDGEHGRDALARAGQLQKVGGGAAGFDFTKLDANGNDLPASAREWSCVRDNHTGLTWEVKTTDGGLRDRNHTYSWYNPDSSTNGGDAGTQNGGQCTGSDCDTHAFVQAVNSQGLCGANDWRIPSRKELLNLVHRSSYPTIDLVYFPNANLGYWSSTPVSHLEGVYWSVSFSLGLPFVNGKGASDGYASSRLVR